ncbi:rod shape-determining protein MreD [Endomicrobium proavitum]|uniref:Rod shape-determining protein MreD n=1 Tax=Endomicrobium proavitum TaxID=1408281 RepID=A0A0G3WJ62_9BACT|nr:rod shape-determining protein MreD [Endomicrobium proavitum]AKL98701.1 Rod shape-determining protein MreD [Endomicrobium proavitum]
MKKAVFYILFFIFFCILQFFFGQFLSVKGVFPNFILIAIVFLALSRGQTSAELTGFFFGLVWDVFSTDILGGRVVMFTVIGYLVGMFAKSFDEDQAFTQITMVFFANIIYWLGFSFICMILPEGSGSYTPFVVTWAGSLKIAVTVLIAPFVFFVLNIAAGMFLPKTSFKQRKYSFISKG